MKFLYSILTFGCLVLLSCEASKSGTNANTISDDEHLGEETQVDESIASSVSSDTLTVVSSESTNLITFDKDPWQINTLSDFSNEEVVKLSFTNISDKKIVIYNPMRKKVERFEDDSWKAVEVMYCRCRPCPAPPETREVSPGKSYTVKWTKKEDSCENNRFNQTDCRAGLYRISIDFNHEGSRLKEYVEFKI